MWSRETAQMNPNIGINGNKWSVFGPGHFTPQEENLDYPLKYLID